MPEVAIIGYGVVGKAMHKIFPDAYIYDINVGFELEVNECELAIICVPTPPKEDGSVDTSIVEEVLSWVKTPLILVKSTVPPGFCERHGVNFSPEYIGESRYQITPWKYMDKDDPRLHDFLIVGGKDAEKIAEIFQEKLGPEKTYYLCTSTEAEIMKYMENSYFAMKVLWAHEFKELCDKLGASYMKCREGWALDNRVDKMHTSVFRQKGFGGKCFPKDVSGIVNFADSVGVNMSVLKAVYNKNKTL